MIWRLKARFGRSPGHTYWIYLVHMSAMGGGLQKYTGLRVNVHTALHTVLITVGISSCPVSCHFRFTFLERPRFGACTFDSKEVFAIVLAETRTLPATEFC